MEIIFSLFRNCFEVIGPLGLIPGAIFRRDLLITVSIILSLCETSYQPLEKPRSKQKKEKKTKVTSENTTKRPAQWEWLSQVPSYELVLVSFWYYSIVEWSVCGTQAKLPYWQWRITELVRAASKVNSHSQPPETLSNLVCHSLIQCPSII